MSRTNKTDRPKNPAQKFLDWSAKKCSWVYWDKTKEAEMEISPKSLAFIVLDQLNTVKGFDRRVKKGIWSNEVRSTKTDTITAKWADGLVAEGLWADIKKDSRLKFVKSVYIAAKINGRYELCNLQLKGSAMSEWIDFTKATDVYTDIACGVTETVKDEVDGKEFYLPKFGVVANSISEEAAKEADSMDKELQSYLKTYFTQSNEPVETQEQAPDPLDEVKEQLESVVKDDYEENVPF
jgi:hypothetical protein